MPDYSPGQSLQSLVAIMGGTFDPIHTGHVRTAIELIEQLGLDALYLVPLNQAVHREQPQADPQTRLEMCRLAAEGHPRLHADECEISRGGASWMVETLESFRRRFPESALCLVLGADAFAKLDSWRRSEDINLLAHIIVVDRPGFDPVWPRCLAGPHSSSAHDLRLQPAGLVCRLTPRQLEIASTDLRERLQKRLSTHLLLPPSVEGLILERGLYQATPKND